MDETRAMALFWEIPGLWIATSVATAIIVCSILALVLFAVFICVYDCVYVNFKATHHSSSHPAMAARPYAPLPAASMDAVPPPRIVLEDVVAVNDCIGPAMEELRKLPPASLPPAVSGPVLIVLSVLAQLYDEPLHVFLARPEIVTLVIRAKAE